MTLESAYYNDNVAMWEPFIEPVEREDSDTHQPWRAVIEVNIFSTDGKNLSYSVPVVDRAGGPRA